MRFLVTLLLLLVGLPALAQTPGNCAPGTAQADLDISDVRARLFNTGSLFFGNTTVNGDGYVVPKFSGRSPLFAANVWVAGFVGGDLHVAGSTYQNFEFWPGPLETGATLPDPSDCSAFDRIWVVTTLDVQQYEDTGVATADLAEWPVDLGAEVIDGDGVAGNYSLEGGDRPRIYGSQTAFWVMNDVGNEHAYSESQPIGLEVRATAFVLAEEPFQRHTLYRYELVNRNTQPFEDARISVWADLDLGDAADDYIGSDSTRGLAFVYNAVEEDATYDTPPAAGLDFLSGSASTRWPVKSGPPETWGPPDTPLHFYNAMSGLWNDGLPITEGDFGYMSDGSVVEWAFPGDPVTEQFWSMVNADGSGGNQPSQDIRHLLNASPFALAPGESRTFDFAVLFAQGEDNLDSITELRAASDLVQAAYDDGTLFDPVAPGAVLSTPELLAPEEGAFFVDGFPLLRWSSVPGAVGYTVRVGLNPDFESASTFVTTETQGRGGRTPANEVVDVYWQVRAEDSMGGLSPYSEPRSFQFYRFESDNYGDGIGVIEVAHPDAEVCPDGSDDVGCAEGYPGNTVWLSPNSTGDYVLTNPDNALGDLLQYVAFIEDDFEVRFTDACAEPSACLGVYASAIPGNADLITSVPFELWNTGAEDDLDDDVRMIPILRAYPNAEPTAAWEDVFPGEQDVVAGEDTLILPVTQRVLGVMPDRPNGYALFADAANNFGGPGATYDPDTDGDDQIDINPGNGEVCGRQNYYVDFCYRGGSTLFVAPIGGLDGFVLADLAGDSTTPPVGTTIRFDSNERLFEVAAEDDGPVAQPQALSLDAAYPNPFRSTTTIRYRLDTPADVRLVVYDVLGRRVAVLAEDRTSAGDHRAAFEGRGLTSGVYLVVLEADGQRETQKVLLLR